MAVKRLRWMVKSLKLEQQRQEVLTIHDRRQNTRRRYYPLATITTTDRVLLPPYRRMYKS